MNRLPAGSELFASYNLGPQDCNAIHLAHYGFTLPGDSACDCAYLQFTLGANPATWPHREHDIALLHAAGIVDEKGKLEVQPRADFKFEDFARAVFPALRVTVLHKMDEPLTNECVGLLYPLHARVCARHCWFGHRWQLTDDAERTGWYGSYTTRSRWSRSCACVASWLSWCRASSLLKKRSLPTRGRE